MTDEEYERAISFVRGMQEAAKILRHGEEYTIGHADASAAVYRGQACSACVVVFKDDGLGVAPEAAAKEPLVLDRPEPSRIPPEALAAVERVLAHRAGVVAEVPGQEVWRTKTPHHQAMKCVSHVKEYHAGERADRDTGESPLAHAAARALLALALELQRR